MNLANTTFLFRDTVSLNWQYPITGPVSQSYSFHTAQSLLEFTYIISTYNRQINQKIPNPVKINPPNFDIIEPLYSTLHLCNIAWLFYSTDLNIMVIAFTATYDDLLVALDIDYVQKDPTTVGNYVSGMKMHGGFWDLYSDIQSTLHDLITKYTNSTTQILITGLSLGGATSTICALDLYNKTRNLVHYSFASPRLFNIFGAQYYNSLSIPSYRIQNFSDIIPCVPLPIMEESEDFLHVNSLNYFDTNLGTYYNNHILAYVLRFNLSPVQ
jgi:hypothetical protein